MFTAVEPLHRKSLYNPATLAWPEQTLVTSRSMLATYMGLILSGKFVVVVVVVVVIVVVVVVCFVLWPTQRQTQLILRVGK
jgi:hypothetical protein